MQESDEFDESQMNCPEYLKRYYKGRIDYWKNNYPIKGVKVIQRYERRIKELIK